eukprot:6798701-Pyramimonas_sp.AAC.2
MRGRQRRPARARDPAIQHDGIGQKLEVKAVLDSVLVDGRVRVELRHIGHQELRVVLAAEELLLIRVPLAVQHVLERHVHAVPVLPDVA